MKIIFSTNSHMQAEILTEMGEFHRLISFYAVQDSPPEHVKVYVETGLQPLYNKRKNKTKHNFKNISYSNRRRVALLERQRLHDLTEEEVV